MRKHLLWTFLTAMLLGILLAPAKGYAACDHEWYVDYSESWERYSDTQCVRVVHYYCTYCDATKTGKEYQKHDWVKHSEGNYIYYPISASECGKYEGYYCDDCDTESPKSMDKLVSKSKHYFCDDGKCNYCDYTLNLSSEIAWKANTAVWAGSDTWLKISVPKDGYVTLTTDEVEYQWDSSYFAVYNASKKLYKSLSSINVDTSGTWAKYYLPLKKGAYYIKFSRITHTKYTFTAFSDKKNSTKKKALTLAKGKTATGIFFTKDTKNEYSEWIRYYKIKVTKTQYVDLYFRDGYFKMTNAKGKEIRLDDTDYGATTDKKLKKGTYYISIGGSTDRVTRTKFTGQVWMIMWK